MKKIFAIMMAAAVAVGCHNDNIVEDIPTTPESEAKTYCDKLTLNVGEQTTRVFDDKLVWSWESTDKIIGYQNDGEKSRNTLNFVSENKFVCDAFTYSTTEAADFHFFYANEETEGTLTAVQDGTWRPVLVGTVKNTQLKNISEVSMEHLSAALEFTLYDENRTATQNIVSAKLTSDSNFVGCWTVDENLEYTQTLSGKEINIELDTPSPTVVFNMPTGVFGDNYLTLTLTTASGITVTKQLPAQTFVAGRRNRFNVATTAAYLPINVTFYEAIRSEMGYHDISKIKFIANSPATNGTTMSTNGNQPIYLIPNGTTLEIHTPASKFVANEDSSNIFYNCNTITEIDFGSFDTSKVTSMYQMFYGCSALTSLDLSSFDTSKVTNMADMFYNCNALTSLDLSSFDTSIVTNMSLMFYGCEALTKLDLSNFNTSKVTDMNQMFTSCKALTSLNVSSFDTSNVANMSYIFSACYKLASLNISSFDTAKVTNMAGMFFHCETLTSLDLSKFNTEKVTNMNQMFNSCKALTSLNVSSFDTSNVIYMIDMFVHCTALTELDLSNFNTEKVTDMSWMFEDCQKLQNSNLILNFSFSSTPSVTSMLTDLGAEGDKYELYVTQEAYDYLTNKGDYGTGKFTLTVKK